MSSTYRELSRCAPSQQSDTYIYAITPTANRGIAAITSADELLLVDRQRLQASSQVVRIQGTPKGLTSLVSADAGSTAICAGRGGVAVAFDLRSEKPSAQVTLDRTVTALAERHRDVALGTELDHHQAVVSVWDRRQNKIRWHNSENNDDITALQFHPSQDHILLSGGDDGLVSIFDTQVPEEDDSLLQAVNHGPIHKAGFLRQNGIYALSSDQNLALYPLTIDDVDSDQPAPSLLGDLRPVIPCEYVIDIFPNGPHNVVASGSHSMSRVDLIPISDANQLDLTRRIILDGAHGEEIVRSLFVDDESGVVFTAGEDGCIKAFGPSESLSQQTTPSKSSKFKKGSDNRYKPY